MGKLELFLAGVVFGMLLKFSVSVFSNVRERLSGERKEQLKKRLNQKDKGGDGG